MIILNFFYSFYYSLTPFLSFSLFSSYYPFSISPIFFLLIPFFFTPPPFSFAFLISGLKSLIKLGGIGVWRRGGSKLEGSGEIKLTRVTAARGKKHKMEMELQQSSCDISLFTVPPLLGDGDDWRWGSTISMNRLYHSGV